jgi:hypothetical protein
MNVSLKEWLRNGWLIEHKTSREEIIDLLAIADRDIADCQISTLSPDWRLNIAYNSALQSATAALAASGYRASREMHHYRVIQSLAYTIGADKAFIAQLDKFRKKRNIGEYDRAGGISVQEAIEMLNLAKTLRKQLEEWLRVHHPSVI